MEEKEIKFAKVGIEIPETLQTKMAVFASENKLTLKQAYTAACSTYLNLPPESQPRPPAREPHTKALGVIKNAAEGGDPIAKAVLKHILEISKNLSK